MAYKTRRLSCAALLASAIAMAGSVAAAPADYPTSAVADYVLGCMKANGETREVLERCSCSIDVLATLLPYERYVQAETFLSLGQVTGERGVLFRENEGAKAAIGDLRNAQIEAELRCF